jgi:hypothetical protein
VRETGGPLPASGLVLPELEDGLQRAVAEGSVAGRQGSIL